MSKYETIHGSIKAKKLANKKENKEPILNASTQSGFGYLVGEVKGKLKVAKNVAFTLAIGTSGLFLSSCASSPMGVNNLVTRQGTTQTRYEYNAYGKLTSRTTSYSEFNAVEQARAEKEYARANTENARAFKTMGQGVRELGRGIEAMRKAFNRY